MYNIARLNWPQQSKLRLLFTTFCLPEMGDEGSFKKGFIAGQKVACKTRVVLAANNTNYIAKIPGIETTP